MSDRERGIHDQTFKGQSDLLKTQGTLLTAQTEHLVSLRDQIRSQTMALFRMIDRLGPGEAGV